MCFKTRVPALYAHLPDSTSTFVVAHLSQRVDSYDFAYYDYGMQINQKIYGQPKPPKYELANITSTDMVLMSGINDFLADPTDVDILRSQLKGNSFYNIFSCLIFICKIYV